MPGLPAIWQAGLGQGIMEGWKSGGVESWNVEDPACRGWYYWGYK